MPAASTALRERLNVVDSSGTIASMNVGSATRASHDLKTGGTVEIESLLSWSQVTALASSLQQVLEYWSPLIPLLRLWASPCRGKQCANRADDRVFGLRRKACRLTIGHHRGIDLIAALVEQPP